MEKHKEIKQVAQMGPIADRDPIISCDLMNGRDAFLDLARDKYH